MKTLDHSLSEPAHNLACVEILLDEVNGEQREPVLRFWEPNRHFAVIPSKESATLKHTAA